jgi:hypothetical protein
MVRTMRLESIDLRKSKGCEHPDISSKKRYLVVYSGEEIIGTFDRQWYGWSFSWFGSAYAGLQLDSFDEVWEIIPDKKRIKIKCG